MSDNPYRLPRHVVPSHYDIRLEPDLDTLTFEGRTAADIEVNKPTRTLVLNAADLEIKTVNLRSGPDSVAISSIKLDAEFERLTVELAEEIQPGGYRLECEFTGTINDQLRGIYESVYRDADGTEHLIATSQCQATDARRVFPCWDEPDFKATFSTTMAVAEGLEAYSNGRELSRTTLADGRVEFQFATTMKMSPYLLAFITGPFEATDPVEVRGIPVRVVVPRGNLHLTAYALRQAVWCLEFLEDYFGIPYPGDKLDHIAIPDFSAGAMENVGLITYRDAYLIIDESKATQSELERSLEVIAHEIAHQWFGNLVTLRWWEGAWLNEAFASFMEDITVDKRRPDWNRMLSFQVGDKTWANNTDHLASTRPIEFEVHSPSEVDEMFDAITYGKGAAVLHQIEQFIGPDQFRTGVSAYLRKHSFSNTATTDLWDALDSASEWPVSAIMDTWVYQRGHPQIDVEETPRGIRLFQHRFLVIPDESDTTLWKVPVILRGSAGGEAFETRVLLADAEADIELPEDLDFILLNAGGYGFYRTRYTDALAAKILDHLDALAPIERHTIVDDAEALMQSGQLPATSFLELVSGFGDETEWAVWAEIVRGLAGLDHHAVAPAAKNGLRAFVARLVRPAYERLGTTAQDAESDLTRKLRGTLLGAMGSLADDPDAIDRSRHLVDDLINGVEVDPELATSALGVVASHATMEDFAKLWTAYRSAATSVDQVRFLRAAAAVNLPEAAEVLLDRIVSGEIRTQEANLVLIIMMMSESGNETWSVVRQRWDEVIGTIPPFSRRWAITSLPYLSKPEVAADVKGFFSERGYPEAAMYLDQRLELLEANVAFRARETPELTSYFA